MQFPCNIVACPQKLPVNDQFKTVTSPKEFFDFAVSLGVHVPNLRKYVNKKRGKLNSHDFVSSCCGKTQEEIIDHPTKLGGT